MFNCRRIALCVLVGANALAFSSQRAVGDDKLIDEALSALRENAARIAGAQGYRLVYRHFVEPVVETESNVKRDWVSEETRQANSLCVIHKFPNMPDRIDGYSWHGGVGCHVTTSFITVEPSYNPAFEQLTSFTNNLFIDTTPSDAVTADGVKEVYASSAPSQFMEFFGLPRSLDSWREQFVVVESSDKAILHLRREGRDDIFLDREHGFVPVHRICQFKPGARLFEVKNLNLKEAAPGVWLPTRQLITRYAVPPAEPSQYGTVVTRERNELTSFEFRKLSAAAFELPMPSSGNVYDRVRRVSYHRIPTGTEPEEALEQAIQLALSHGSQLADARHSTLSSWLMIANLLVVLVIAVAIRKNRLEARSAG
jgi:hypothetical protein